MEIESTYRQLDGTNQKILIDRVLLLEAEILASNQARRVQTAFDKI
jgi:hypothetical protein